jgi:hypothetical protein
MIYLTYQQKKLKTKHGTPQQFREALWKAYSTLDITFAEMSQAIEKYDLEWRTAGTDGRWSEKSDGEKFLAFFESMGIRTSIAPWDIHRRIPRRVKFGMSVSQAIFLFDIRWRFVGTLSDEQGDFEERPW